MRDSIITVHNLGKSYRIGHLRQKPQTIREAVRQMAHKPFAYLVERLRDPTEDETLWALRNVSFEVKRGEVLGLVGRNGAGKSTLLKILSRITDPTEGRASIKGRVNSLLEVGTGFHPELTGRENIFMNAAIYGLRRSEILKKFDEIVAFSEVEKFIDTPVKRYSSGMYTRLAFGVAAHLEPDILLVDEVLAVGDAEFRKKSLNKMQGVAREGRTVFLVSHNMEAVLSLCNRALLLSGGRLIADDRPQSVVGKYLDVGGAGVADVVAGSACKPGQKLKITRVRVVDGEGNCRAELDKRSGLTLEMEFCVMVPGRGYVVSFQLNSMQHGCIFTTSSWDTDVEGSAGKVWRVGEYRATVKLPEDILRRGDYYIKATSAIPAVEVLDVMGEELRFTLLDTTGPLGQHREGRQGAILPVLPWSVESSVAGV
jgi:lipopolysaccharide transport system ATP-binding protein